MQVPAHNVVHVVTVRHRVVAAFRAMAVRKLVPIACVTLDTAIGVGRSNFHLVGHRPIIPRPVQNGRTSRAQNVRSHP